MLGPEYQHSIVKMPSSGIPVTVTSLDPMCIHVTPSVVLTTVTDGMVTSVALMANGVTAAAPASIDAQLPANPNPQRTRRRQTCMTASTLRSIGPPMERHVC